VTAPTPGLHHRTGAPRLQRWGKAGSRVLLVHGLVANGEATWSQQRPLAPCWDMLVVDRRGYFPNPRIEREDFEIDAVDVADLLVDLGPLHLVGHSYGGVVCLLAAALAPRGVRSLALIEPPAFGAAADDPDVEAFSAELRALFEEGPNVPGVFLNVFLGLCGFEPREQPGALPEPLLQHARLLQATRHPGEAVVPFEILRRAPFPKVVFSGGHSPAFEKVSDVIADGVGARRLTITGCGHAVQRTGAPFNAALQEFWRAAEATERPAVSS
jgi:pimeloyl-ACP methyl ester carboxylesterase